jgi:hypothetical protein
MSRRCSGRRWLDLRDGTREIGNSGTAGSVIYPGGGRVRGNIGSPEVLRHPHQRFRSCYLPPPDRLRRESRAHFQRIRPLHPHFPHSLSEVDAKVGTSLMLHQPDCTSLVTARHVGQAGAQGSRSRYCCSRKGDARIARIRKNVSTPAVITDGAREIDPTRPLGIAVAGESARGPAMSHTQ